MYFVPPIRSGLVALAAASLLATLGTPARPQDDGFGRAIMGGPSTGTYIKFAQDISNLAASCGIDLEVVESEGGFDNFLAVRKRPYTQLGISRSDILEYMRTYEVDDPAVRQIAFGMRVALPLYDEEVQILARRDIETFEDLDGMRVGVGPDGSGTFLTSQLVMDLAGVVPAEKVSIPFEDMLPALLADEIDAFFQVAGAPTTMFQQPQIDPEAHHLLPITNETLRAVYEPVTIPAGTYPFQDEPVETVAAKALLMAYEFDPGEDSYHARACDTVSDVSHIIVTRLEQLREEGHPKWSQIDLTDIPPGWEVASCVTRGLQPDYPFECAPAEVSASPDSPDAVTPEADINEAYRQQICSLVDC